MDFMNLGPAGVLTVGIIAGAFASAAIGFIVYKVLGGIGFGSRGHRHAAYESFDEFIGKIRLLEQKQHVLADYSGQYFNTLQGSGWDNLVALLDSLRSVEGELNIMLEQRRYGDVKAVCDYLMGRLGEVEAQELAAEYDGLSELQNWRQSSREILLKIIQATTSSAQQTQELGISRKKRDRKPTLVSLSDLRGSLGDF
jgi:hypothetical protein